MEHHEFRVKAKEMVDYVADYLENVRDRRVSPGVQPGYLHKRLPTHAPEEGEKWDDIFKDIDAHIMPGLVHWQSPHMHAYFPALTSYPSILGELLASGLNVLCFTWASSPAGTELETISMNWTGKIIGLPECFLNESNDSRGGGVIQTTASEATLVSLLAARTRALMELKELNPDLQSSELLGHLICYCSDQAHSSVEKAGLIGLVRMRYIETDDQQSMRGDKLEEAIVADKEKGLVPFWVCATLGTTGSVAFDNLREIGEVCDKHSAWLHVDAAYAGSAFVCPEYRHWLDGVEMADSFAFNPSKWFLVNFDCTGMWVKDSTALHKTFNVNPIYLRHENSGKAIDYMVGTQKSNTTNKINNNLKPKIDETRSPSKIVKHAKLVDEDERFNEDLKLQNGTKNLINEPNLANSNENLSHDIAKANNNAKLTNGDENLTKGNSKLMNGDEKLTKGNTKLTNGDEKLTKGNTKLTNADEKLTKGNTKLTNADEKLTKGNTKLTNGDEKLTEGNAKLINGNVKLTNGKITLTSDDEIMTNDADCAGDCTDSNLHGYNKMAPGCGEQIQLENPDKKEALHWQIPLSRRFRSLKLWFVLRSYGVSGLQKHIREGCRLAQKFEALVLADQRFEIPQPRNLGLVVFRLKGENVLTERLLKRLNGRGIVHAVPACFKNTYVIRFTVTSPRTTNQDIIDSWNEIKLVATELLKEIFGSDNGNIVHEKKPRISLKETRKLNETFGTSLLLANSPMSPKIVNGTHAAICDYEQLLTSCAHTFAQLKMEPKDSPEMRRRIRGIRMCGKKFSLDSCMDMVQGIIAAEQSLPKCNEEEREDASNGSSPGDRSSLTPSPATSIGLFRQDSNADSNQLHIPAAPSRQYRSKSVDVSLSGLKLDDAKITIDMKKSEIVITPTTSKSDADDSEIQKPLNFRQIEEKLNIGDKITQAFENFQDGLQMLNEYRQSNEDKKSENRNDDCDAKLTIKGPGSYIKKLIQQFSEGPSEMEDSRPEAERAISTQTIKERADAICKKCLHYKGKISK